MLSMAHLFVAQAFADDAAPVAGAPEGLSAGMMNYLPFILIFAVFYFLVIRPQQTKLAEQEKMIKALQRGDRVVTSGGLHGKISEVADKHVMLEIANDVHVKVLRDAVQAIESKPMPVASVGTKS